MLQLGCVSAILSNYRLITIVKLFSLIGTILVDVCEDNDENDLPKNQRKHAF